MVISRPLCAVQHAQDHDGLLEFGEVKTNEAVASSMRAASEPLSQVLRNHGVHRDIEPLRNKATSESSDIDSPVRRPSASYALFENYSSADRHLLGPFGMARCDRWSLSLQRVTHWPA